jgi:FKBP-type peptidyl-prolyl cis-trans isomerase SlyD
VWLVSATVVVAAPLPAIAEEAPVPAAAEGESAEVSVNPEEGYGPVDPAAFIEIPRTQLPADVTPEVGMVLRGINPDGQNFQARIGELKEESAVLNLNHPLAGKTLNFKVKILDLSPAPAPRDADEPLQVPAERAP